ncbi:MAG: Flp family type IVb pilin [Marinobacter sp.]|nr:Flp family type IVb pilin [Marinobacter sp.]
MKIQTTTSVFTRFSNRHRNRKMTSTSNQKGASALEYLVLAAAIVLIIGVAMGTGLGDQVTQAFSDLFTDAASGGGGTP